MTDCVACIIDKLRKAGFTINALRSSPLWAVDGHGNMSNGQLIALASKLELSSR